MGIIRSAKDVLFVRQRWIEHAYVVYDHRWERARGRILGWLEARGIKSIGRYGDWNYSAMEDALVRGRTCARELVGR
jgi:hypothetical protein